MVVYKNSKSNFYTAKLSSLTSEEAWHQYTMTCTVHDLKAQWPWPRYLTTIYSNFALVTWLQYTITLLLDLNIQWPWHCYLTSMHNDLERSNLTSIHNDLDLVTDRISVVTGAGTLVCDTTTPTRQTSLGVALLHVEISVPTASTPLTLHTGLQVSNVININIKKVVNSTQYR